ncbi:EamA family transporter [Chromobacterium alticapitis]|uniref:EamA family transporter n=1 Tax=Chromobacterium alticapitis TaxID=2073169 RepID=A0A2S5DB85_9NEIS|nr:EamA family transporter [Chromobacterium alticapitis]POZ60346.1 EamA family transporter [Chromobacterium alticapitis]
MSVQRASAQWGDVLITALVPVIWGSTYIVTTQLLPPDRPFTAALLRVLPAGLLLACFGGWRPAKGQWGRMLLLSFLNIGAFQALLFVAAYRLPGGLAAVVGACQPLLVMMLAWQVERRKPARLALWASLSGVAGMAALLLSTGSHWDGLGMLAAFGGAVVMACGTYLTRRWRFQAPVAALTGWQLTLGGLMLLPLAWIVDPPLPALSATQIGGYVYLTVFGALIAYLLWFRGIARLSAVAVTSLGLLSPLTAVALGWALLGQALSAQSVTGLLIVLISVLAVQWSMITVSSK